MPARTVSVDLESRIPALRSEGYSVHQICDLLTVRKALVYKTLLHKYKVTRNPHRYSESRLGGRPPILSQADLFFIQAALKRRHTLHLDELQRDLFTKRGVHASLSTLARAVKRVRITRKVVTAPALERNDELRALYMNRIGAEAPDANMLVFIDESAKDEPTSLRKYGRSGEGRRFFQCQHFVRGTRYSILPALTLDGIIAYDIVEGPVTGERFVQFLKDYVMPFTTPYPGPRSVLVMDNCSIHHSKEVRKLVEDMHLCKIMYLPPSSPGYNPINAAFSTIKAYLQRDNDDGTLMAIVRACQSITPDDAEGYYRASGYIA